MDNDAFIFSVSKKTKHLCHDKQYSIYKSTEDSVTFGEAGSDIYISHNCNTDGSYCYLGNSYTPPNGLTFNTLEANSYLAGSLYFKVIDIEVYAVKF